MDGEGMYFKMNSKKHSPCYHRSLELQCSVPSSFRAHKLTDPRKLRSAGSYSSLDSCHARAPAPSSKASPPVLPRGCRESAKAALPARLLALGQLPKRASAATSELLLPRPPFPSHRLRHNEVSEPRKCTYASRFQPQCSDDRAAQGCSKRL